MEVLNERLISAAEAKGILDKKDKEKMTYEQRIASDFLGKNMKMSSEDGEKMKHELKEIGLSEEVAVIVINMMPKNADEAKLAFPKDRMAPRQEDLEKISDIVKKYE